MPRFKPKGSLERTALADLWKHTLSRVPTEFGRLAYLASLRDPNSGKYHHHGLTMMFGREESRLALQESHDRVFREWLIKPLAEKTEEIGQYLDSLKEDRQQVLSHWLGWTDPRAYSRDSQPGRTNAVPTGTGSAHRVASERWRRRTACSRLNATRVTLPTISISLG